MVQRRQRESIAREAVDGFAAGVSLLPQTGVAVDGARTPRPRCVGAGGGAGLPPQSAPRQAYLCWYDNHAEPGAAVVGSSNLTLAGFSGNTELNVRVPGEPVGQDASRRTGPTMMMSYFVGSFPLTTALSR